MGQPVKLSEELVLDARIVGQESERSIAAQIEYWARVGRGVESLLRTDQLLRLKHRGEVMPLSECLSSVDSDAGRRRLEARLASGPFPHFEAAAGKPGLIVKLDEDGTRTVGRFVRRQFMPVARK